MKINLIYTLLICTLCSCATQRKNIKLVFCGDVILDRGVDDQLRLHGDSLLTNSFRCINNKDYLIMNLEGTITQSGIAQKDKYNFKSDSHRAISLKKAGVTHASVANNHIYDFGQEGFSNTIDALKENRIIPLGENSVPKIIKEGNIKCAILSASLTTNNDSLAISNIDDLKSSILDFRKHETQIPLILYIHWGLELQPTPEKWQRELANELIEMGTDAIIGHHPHTTQSIEFINGKPVFYSIGNFIADAYLPLTNISYTVKLEITDKINSINIAPVRIRKYFPGAIELKDQISDLREHLKYSENVCAIKKDDSWQIKPSRDINFEEATDLWIISEKSSISTIKRLSTGSHLLNIRTSDNISNTINLHGKLSEFEIGDINNDNNLDILLGVSKKVKFDPTEKKRVNIYTIENNVLRPLWLGTKFINDIDCFSIKSFNNLNYLGTTEIDKNGKNIHRIYCWDNFGFALTELK